MKYSKERKIEVLATGYCFGLLYYILNLGTHPTAYIKLPNNSSIDENEIDVHGGITYSEDHLWINDNEKLDGKFIGWDYAHFGDYIDCGDAALNNMFPNNKKWTTEEIVEECKNVIDQIVEKYHE